jgi:hypothetical protein
MNAKKLLNNNDESRSKKEVKDESTYFCSELVAAAYKRLGLL